MKSTTRPDAFEIVARTKRISPAFFSRSFDCDDLNETSTRSQETPRANRTTSKWKKLPPLLAMRRSFLLARNRPLAQPRK